MHRRRFLQLSALGAAQLLAFGARAAPAVGFGPLVADPDGRLDLPAGFRGVRLQAAGEPMADGHRVPGRLDGMTAHQDAKGDYVLLRNHELSDAAWVARAGIPADRVPTWRAEDAVVDRARHGGVTRVVVDRAALLGGARDGLVKDTRLVLAGTDLNCGGGRVPEGWVSCEESGAPGHGWAWLVPTAATGLGQHRRLDTWGRFRREAVVVLPDGGVYQTEDDRAGLLYRFLPAGRDPYGPGRLQALSVPVPTTHVPGGVAVAEGAVLPVSWVDIPDPAAGEVACAVQGAARGATPFFRGEGITSDGRRVWFVATQGGPAGAGQVWELDLAAATLRLRVQVTDRAVLSMPDNLVRAPWGDLVLCEDNYDAPDGRFRQHLRGLDRDGRVYPLARNPQGARRPDDAAPGDEFAGACFSPDGRVLFVNLQGDRDETWAIVGPWPAA